VDQAKGRGHDDGSSRRSPTRGRKRWDVSGARTGRSLSALHGVGLTPTQCSPNLGRRDRMMTALHGVGLHITDCSADQANPSPSNLGRRRQAQHRSVRSGAPSSD
jgi:hypothetical protein